jgi:hypothetical protein
MAFMLSFVTGAEGPLVLPMWTTPCLRIEPGLFRSSKRPLALKVENDSQGARQLVGEPFSLLYYPTIRVDHV